MHDIEVVAHCAWDEYYNQMAKRVQHPRGRGPTLHGSKYFKAFMRIAEQCVSMGYDVRDFVASALTVLQKDPNYVTPKDLTSTQVMVTYQNQVKARNNVSKAESEWHSQEITVRTLQAQRPDVFVNGRALFMSSWMPFDAWFRVFYFEPADPEILGTYGRQAWAELQPEPALRRLLYTRRPATMKQLQDMYGYFGDLEPNGKAS